MEITCETCGNIVVGERPKDNHYECWLCDECGRYWDESYVHNKGKINPRGNK